MKTPRKAVMVMFDSLNRHLLPPYGCDWIQAPNFARLAARCLTFDRSYICSMPCMPARRELHTARPNFLHRGWGPIEPFDDSVPEILKTNGIHSHLASDHYHYWEDGGATYHPRYSTWECFRGQEGDPWIGQVRPPDVPPTLNRHRPQDWINRAFTSREELMPQRQTFNAGLDFIRRNRDENNWFLQIETFDPHEPFFSPQNYKDLYPHTYSGPHFDWPAYGGVTETPEQVAHVRAEYAALVSMCDAHLGKILDAFDELSLWDDTMLIVWTDHGFLLGEHGGWAKNWCPWWEEISHTPFWIHDPRAPHPGERRDALVQPSLDLGPTLLEFFGLEPTQDMIGKSLRAVIENDTPVREAALFGSFGAEVYVTDGRYVYLHAPVSDGPLHEYTLMPTRMNRRMAPDQLQCAELAPPFGFSKACPLLKIPAQGCPAAQNQLFDLQSDPGQMAPLRDAQVEARLRAHLENLFAQCEAPREQWTRLGLD